MSKQPFIKTVSERFTVPKRKGGGLIKIEVWENEDGSRYQVQHGLCQSSTLFER